MLRFVLCCGLCVGVSAAGALADERVQKPSADMAAPSVQPASAPPAPSAAPAAAPERTSTPAAQPARDPTLIEVPSNTLGPGVPLWLLREHAESAARIARANADYAEAVAAEAGYQAQRAADDQPYYDPYGSRYGVVVYGPHLPGLRDALRARPVPFSSSVSDFDRRADRGVPTDNDPFDAAQRRFYQSSRPRIAPTIERQLEAQRRFGENATPPISGIQSGIDNAVINARRGAPLPGAADDQREAPRPHNDRPRKQP